MCAKWKRGRESDASHSIYISSPAGTTKAFANEMGIPFLETSAKTATNVEQAFVKMAQEIKQRITTQPVQSGASTLKVGAGKPVKQDKGCC